MEKCSRRFCCFEGCQDPADVPADSPPNLLASALERHNVPYRLLVERIDPDQSLYDSNSCDRYPQDVASPSGFRYEFLTTDEHYHRAAQIAELFLRQSDSTPS